ncbi:MAG: aminopeptidase P family protein, partial [Candidatus Aminicenantales bacterium]
MIIREKVKQAIQILKEYEIDCWMTFVRESSIMHDPMLDFLVEADVTWHSAFILNKTGQTYALVGQMDRQTIEDLGVYDHVLSYVKGIKEQLCQTIKQLNPAKIAVNYSRDSEISDGLTHGMYLTLYEFLSEIEYADRIVSAEK